VAITADGRLTVSASIDNAFRVSDLEICDEIELFYEDGELRSYAVHGNIIVAGDSLGRVHVLELE